MQRQWSVDDGKCVLWSDESSFELEDTMRNACTQPLNLVVKN